MFETVPTVAFPPATPFTCQFTAVFEVFATVAANCCVAPTATEAVAGLTVTVTGGGAVTVTAAVPVLLLSAFETAATVTVAGAGTDAGAV